MLKIWFYEATDSVYVQDIKVPNEHMYVIMLFAHHKTC